METSSNKRIVKNTAFLYARMLMVLGVSLYTARLVLEALGAEDFGLYNVVGGIVGLFTIINGALSGGSSRFITFELGTGDKAALRKTFSASFAIHGFIAIIIFILAETVGLWYVNTCLVVPEGRLTAANWVYQFSIIGTMLSITQVPYGAMIIAQERMNIYAWVGIAEAVFKLFLIYLLLHVQSVDRLIFYSLLMCLWSICLQVYYRFYCVRNFTESKLMIVKEKVIYKKMLAFSLWDLVGNFCVTGNSQGINLLLNYFFGVVVNAARGVAFQVEGALTMFSHNFMTAVRPQIVKLFAEGNFKKMLSLMVESSKYSYFLLYIVVLPVFLEADYILAIWLKEVPEHTSLFLRCILLNSLIRSFATPVVQAVHATGNIKWLNLYAGGTSVLLTLPLIYFAYRSGYPAEVAFYIVCIVSIICNYLELFVLKKEIPFNILKYTLHVYSIGFLITGLSIVPIYCLYQLLESSFYRLLIVCVADLFLVGLSVFFIGISPSDREKIISTGRKKIMYYVGK
jgi:O-antigen/teichoic acid export membrane protein